MQLQAVLISLKSEPFNPEPANGSYVSGARHPGAFLGVADHHLFTADCAISGFPGWSV